MNHKRLLMGRTKCQSKGPYRKKLGSPASKVEDLMHTKQLAAQIGVFAPILDGATQALSEKIRMGVAYARMQQESHDSSSDNDSDCC